jgi:glucose/mannose-6-phosphate isomerase
MILDDIESIKSIDTSNMFHDLYCFPEQILSAKTIVEQSNLSKQYNIQHIIISGMGGSAISGDILKQYTEEKGFLPISVYRSYQLPKWINKQTLVFSQSYSGNTEETLNAFKHAYEKKCPIITISSNGKLMEYSNKRSIPFIKIPSGLQPRSAVGYMFFCSLFSLQKIGLFKSIIDNDINESIEITKNLIQSIKPSVPSERNLAKQIAQQLHLTIPQIYGWHFYESIALRWTKQINENSKMIARYDFVPESNHNDIVAWSEHSKATKLFSVILFRDAHLETLRMKTRLDFMKTFYHQVASKVIEIHTEGKTPLAKMMYLLVLGDYVSCYLAILQKKDPSPVSIINQLKETLQNL